MQILDIFPTLSVEIGFVLRHFFNAMNLILDICFYYRYLHLAFHCLSSISITYYFFCLHIMILIRLNILMARFIKINILEKE